MARKSTIVTEETTATNSNVATLSEIRKVLSSVNSQLEKKFGLAHNPLILLGDHPERMTHNRVSTGNPAIDKVLGGGLVTGVPIEIYGLPGTGKAHPYGTKIMTKEGHINIENIEIGDQVLTHKNTVTTVTGVFPQGYKSVYKIFLDDGTVVKSCKEHLWPVKTSRESTEVSVLSLETIYKKINRQKYFLPNILSVDLGLESDLGVSTEVDYKQEFESFQSSTGLECWTPSKEFFFSSAESRHSFLNLFVDYIIPGNPNNIKIDCVNKKTAFNLQSVVHSLGYYCKVFPTKDPEKKSILFWTIEITKKLYCREIIGIISEDDKEQCICIQVDDKDHLYLIDYYVPTHNTTTSLYIAKEFIKQGKNVLFVNVEQQALPLEQLTAAGISGSDLDRFIIVPAFGSGENLFNVIKDFLLDPVTLHPRHLVHCIIIDSIAALAPANEMKSIEKNGFDGDTMALHAKMVGKFLRQMAGTGAIPLDSSLVLINQLRATISTGPTPSADTSTGGKSIPYFAKLRLHLKKDFDGCKKLVDSSNLPTGLSVFAEVVKNNTGLPGRRANYSFIYGEGLDIKGPIIEEAMEYGIISAASAVMWEVPNIDNPEEKLRVKGLGGMKTYVKEDTYFEFLKKLVEDYRTSTEELPSDLLENIESIISEEIE